MAAFCAARLFPRSAIVCAGAFAGKTIVLPFHFGSGHFRPWALSFLWQPAAAPKATRAPVNCNPIFITIICGLNPIPRETVCAARKLAAALAVSDKRLRRRQPHVVICPFGVQQIDGVLDPPFSYANDHRFAHLRRLRPRFVFDNVPSALRRLAKGDFARW